MGCSLSIRRDFHSKSDTDEFVSDDNKSDSESSAADAGICLPLGCLMMSECKDSTDSTTSPDQIELPAYCVKDPDVTPERIEMIVASWCVAGFLFTNNLVWLRIA